jgi:hypothetical protein
VACCCFLSLVDYVAWQQRETGIYAGYFVFPS